MKEKPKKLKIAIENINRKESTEKGKIVAIDLETGDYFIGDSEMSAYKKAVLKHPNKKFIFKRIGFKHTHFVGALR